MYDGTWELELGSLGDGTSARVENKFTMICLRGGKIEQYRIAVVKFRMNKESGYTQ